MIKHPNSGVINHGLACFAVAFREALARPASLGLIGADRIKEAFAGDYQQLGELLRGTLRTLWKMTGDEDPWPYVRAVFDTTVVVERDGKLLSYPYTIDGTTVTLGQPAEVVQKYVPAAGGAMTEANAGGSFLEAKGAGYRIRVIRAGLSGNRNFYPDAVLREALPLFEGARVFVKADKEHLAGEGKSFRNLIGGISKPIFVEGKSPDSGEVQADFTLIDPNGPEAVKLAEAWKQGMTGLFGFSIDADGLVRPGSMGGQPARIATKFTEVKSVDLIVQPGAGGQVIGLIEAKRGTLMDREELIRLLEAKGLLKGKDVSTLTDEQLKTMLTEAIGTAPAPGTAPAGVTPEQLREATRMVEARAQARATIAASNLPPKAKEKLTADFGARAAFTEADVEKAIKDERDYLASFTESGHVRMGDLPRIEGGQSRREKVEIMLDAFFDPSHKDHKHARSFKECYVSITGDKHVTGHLQECDQALLRESLDSGSFANVLGNSITRRMVADYHDLGQYDVWRQIAGTPVPISDFRSNERTRFGGYGDLPIVGQGGPYVAQASPTDEKATYAVQKRGGTEDVTIEMIANDDVGAIQRIPMRLSRAAKRTLSKFVLDFIRTNPTIYDGLALFHATHGNLGAAALDATSLAARRLAMLKQTELSSADRIGIGPKGILVPFDLQQAAVDLFKLSTNNEKSFLQQLTLDVTPVWYWTDTNDWTLYADPNDIPGLEIGFLNGKEEPELFVQDNPTSGSIFTNDKLTWKLRHIYGGNITDYRQFDKSVV